MKKFISLILSMLIASGVCFGVAGCGEKDPINYTAVEPFIKYEWEKQENGTDTVYTIKGYSYIAKFNDYESTAGYYKDNLKGSNIFILNYGYELDGCALNEGIDRNRVYRIFKNIDSDKVLFYNSFLIYDSELGSVKGKGKPKPGVYPYSLTFSMVAVPIKICASKVFTFEFGKSKEEIHGYNKYINIFYGDECFATCYFDNRNGKIRIPEEWFKNYFTQNLIWGDSL